jgi:hypothetical protein
MRTPPLSRPWFCLVNGEWLSPCAGPHVPATFNAAITPWRIGPDRASCGAAAFTKQRVIVPNISKDPRWPDGLGLIDCLDSNHKIKKSKCFIWCRLGARKPFFLSLSCTEFVPNSQSTQHCVVSRKSVSGTAAQREYHEYEVKGFCGAKTGLCLRCRCWLDSRPFGCFGVDSGAETKFRGDARRKG